MCMISDSIMYSCASTEKTRFGGDGDPEFSEIWRSYMVNLGTVGEFMCSLGIAASLYLSLAESPTVEPLM
jgi:hypothetical protein